ncbi:hypothetical protein [Campylobacter fetus]|uniref:hypothetical protein n=1 Tax=Campylobacter fetus TaxID=196 RepID=UPI000FCACA11|nr:hypothetical protein [Campylobacter fetus]RUT50516.1 hypothetical protein BWK67_04835 [Campylobacter fetus]RUT50833.1 hypothetical protein BWK51_04815 [Campylobacter fetus]
MKNSAYFTLSEQLLIAIETLKKGNIENYPDVILYLCKKLSRIYINTLKELMGHNRYNLDYTDKNLFLDLRKIDDSNEYIQTLEIFAKFSSELETIDENSINKNNPILEKYGIEWLEKSLNDMSLISSFMDIVKEKNE